MIFESNYNARFYSDDSCWKAYFEGGNFVIKKYAMPKRNIIQIILAWFNIDVGPSPYLAMSTSFTPSQISDVDIYIDEKWTRMNIVTTEEEYCLDGSDANNLHELRNKILDFVNEYFVVELNYFVSQTQNIENVIDNFYNEDKYLSRYDVKLFYDENEAEFNNVNYEHIEEIILHSLFDEKNKPANLFKCRERLRDLFGERDELRSRNKKFVRDEKMRYSGFFDKVEKTPLTEEQRHAAVVMEDRHLLIAAAGSGKTSAIVGKVGYVLNKKIYKPQQILALAFNRKAAEELKERIGERLGDFIQDDKIEAKTFHSYGLEIIANAEGKKPSLAEWAKQDTGIDGGEIEEIIEEAAQENPQFLKLLTYFRYDLKPIHKFKSWTEYKKYLISIGLGGGERSIVTINGELVRSLQELAIANYLYVEGVNYHYEGNYEYDTATRSHSQYHPDFCYPDKKVYHEHFALNKEGELPSFIDKSYLDDMKWKRELHKIRNTILIETTSAMFDDGTIFDHLKAELEKHGIIVGENRRSWEEITERLEDHVERPFYSLMKEFLKHWKAGELTEGELFYRADNLPGYKSRRVKIFLEIMIQFRKIYENKLHQGGEIDFVDMIIRSKEAIKQGKAEHDFQLILVDEFQDISRDRASLLQAMLEQKPECKLFAVGDDWQSIYRFTGADISIMANYADEFGHAAKGALTKTFRSNQGITNVSAEFVGKNPDQFNKKVVAKDKTCHQVVQAIYHRDEHTESIIEMRLEELAAQTQDTKISVYILGRYNLGKDKNLRLEKIKKWKGRFADRLKIEYLTVHRAKGLEADYVFVWGLQEGKFGFPNGMSDDSILELVMPRKEEFELAEERRLFYVALTRARHKVFLLVNNNKPSRFINEIMEGSDNTVERFLANKDTISQITESQICPRCKEGLLIMKSSPNGDFWSCSTYPLCEYKPKLCPKCLEGFMQEPTDKNNNLWVCSSHPSCDHMVESCPECKRGFLIKRAGSYGNFWGCSTYPICEHKPVNCSKCSNGFMRKPVDKNNNLWVCSSHPSCDHTIESCPECKSGFLVKRTGSYGNFWGCSTYPICEHKPVSCSKCSKGFMRKSTDKNNNLWVCSSHLSCDHTVESCPECKRGFLVKVAGRYGDFWGCSNFSKLGCEYKRNIPKSKENGQN